MNPAIPAQWTEAALKAARFEADPLADGVVARVYEAGAVNDVNRMMMSLVHPGRVRLDPALQALLDDYLAQTAVLPAWADQDRIRQCEDFFSSHGALSSAILCCASLPECYLDASDAPVLSSTTQLTKHFDRRIFETSHMVVTAMQEGGMAPGGPGVGCVQRVRLMHAGVRRLLTAQAEAAARGEVDASGLPVTAPWKMSAGVPISQEAMAFVVLSFSYVGVRSLERLGFTPDPALRDAYVHTWSVIGHVMGVRDDLLVHTFDDARLLFETIKAGKRGASADGVALTAAMLAWMKDVLPTLLQPLPREMLVHLMGEADAALLGVTLDRKLHEEESFWDHAVHGVLDMVEPLLHLPVAQRMSEALFHTLTKIVWSRHKAWDVEAFGLPPSLRQAWRIGS
jgi:hypothetical protein